jgi:hypothetical protein
MNEQRTGIGRHPVKPDHRVQPSKKTWSAILGGLMLALLLVTPSGVAVAGKPIIDVSYANGEVVYMIGPRIITDPNPNLFAQSEELYIVAYPINENPGTDTAPKSLPASGYEPQCNPCYHFGPPSSGDTFAYHDHVLSGSPGFGRNGTAGDFKGPWKIILLKYNASVLSDPNFTPVKSAAELDAAELEGKFQQINPGAANPYEVELPVILICPLVSSHG